MNELEIARGVGGVVVVPRRPAESRLERGDQLGSESLVSLADRDADPAARRARALREIEAEQRHQLRRDVHEPTQRLPAVMLGGDRQILALTEPLDVAVLEIRKANPRTDAVRS